MVDMLLYINKLILIFIISKNLICLDMQNIPTKIDIINAYQRIKNYIHKTPVLDCNSVNTLLGSQIYLKCQNFQKIGAYKMRGATNKLLQLNKDVKGVCTHSSGNHGQALACISNLLNIPCYVIMPQNSPEVKKKSVKNYNAHVLQSGNTLKQREQLTNKTIKQHDLLLVHAYNDLDIITGASTVAYELFQQMNQQNIELDYLVFPIGGGGLASGTLLSTKYFSPKTIPIGVEPQLAMDAYLSLKQNKIHPQLPPKTIADGLRTSLGSLTFPIIRDHVKDIILVSQIEILEATRLVFERMKIIIEPSSATVIAAIAKDNRFKNKKVGAIISGGNVDFTEFFKSLEKTIYKP